ncbi:MAG: hypothetical protein C4321_10265 [Chloroflexota bacterium]
MVRHGIPFGALEVVGFDGTGTRGHVGGLRFRQVSFRMWTGGFGIGNDGARRAFGCTELRIGEG